MNIALFPFTGTLIGISGHLRPTVVSGQSGNKLEGPLVHVAHTHVVRFGQYMQRCCMPGFHFSPSTDKLLGEEKGKLQKKVLGAQKEREGNPITFSKLGDRESSSSCNLPDSLDNSECPGRAPNPF